MKTPILKSLILVAAIFFTLGFGFGPSKPTFEFARYYGQPIEDVVKAGNAFTVGQPTSGVCSPGTKCAGYMMVQHVACGSAQHGITTEDGKIVFVYRATFNLQDCAFNHEDIMPTVSKFIGSDKPDWIVKLDGPGTINSVQVRGGYGDGKSWWGKVDAYCKLTPFNGKTVIQNFSNCRVANYSMGKCAKSEDCKTPDWVAKNQKVDF